MSDEKSMSLLLVEDQDDFRETCAEWMVRKGHDVAQAPNGHDAIHACSKKQFDVIVLDLNMPGLSGLEVLDRFRADCVEAHVIVLTGEATIDSAVQAMKLGAHDYLCKPFPLPELEKRCRMAFEHGQLRKENLQLKEVVRRSRPSGPRMIGESPPMQRIFRLIERAGPSDKAILIQGESGTGKELVARALQLNSHRADKPFITINCAALPEQLVESELFGHEKGSFTGATDTRPGLFEVADGGTLFIDEIGEMPLALQPKLLRVLEDGSMRRVGSHKERRVDVRIVAATNRDLSFEIEEGNFREDLYYRINVLTIELPPLKDRQGDVDLLINHILGSNWTLEEDAQQALLDYHWPGNIRQLINVLERAQILADDGEITLDDLPSEVVHAERSHPGATDTDTRHEQSGQKATPSSVRLEDLERAHVVRILSDHRGNKAQAARALGIHRRKLYRMLERFNIQPEETQSS
ncbi:MAG: sigma-54-dependent Fis family transcriptional regulator [Rhodopirellula sp.]|nr:sigma-54-dependent Fis family transcriptional regulator [Rhodopirellula sp.]